jgi:hypothetical protein
MEITMMDAFHQTDAGMAAAVFLSFLGLIVGLLAIAWCALRHRRVQRFCNDEVENMPWNAAAKAFNSGKPKPELFEYAQTKAAAVIGNSVLSRCFNGEQIADMEYTYAVSEMNSHIAADPLVLAVYRRVENLCREARAKLSPFGQSIASVRNWLQAQIAVAIAEETRRLNAPICSTEVDEFKNMSADDPRFRDAFNRWLAGA